MNIRSAEITVLLEEILKESLQAGIAPDVVELANSTQFHNVGTIQSGVTLDTDIAKSDEVNENLAKIEYYMKVLDTAAGEQLDSTEKHRNSYPDRIARLERWYRELAYKVSSLLIMIRTGTNSLYSITEAFSSVDKVNLTTTTAYIDTDAGLARIPFSKAAIAAETGTDNLRISNVKLIDGDKVQYPDGLFLGSLYHKYITRSMSGVSLEVGIQVLRQNDSFRGGFIEFDLGFASNTKIKSIKGTSDFRNYEEMAFLQNGKHVVIPVSVLFKDKSLTVTLEKETYEGVKIDENGTIQHQFIFEITNLRLPNNRYKDSASIYSIAFDIPEVLKKRGVSKLRLKTSEALLTGDNRIDSYISLNSGGWQKIVSGEDFPIGVCSELKSYHPNGTTIRELPTPIFKLEGKSPEIVIEQSRLWEGYGQAEVETVAYNEAYSTLEQWANFKGIRAYQSLGKQGVYLGPQKAHKIYTVIRSDRNRQATLTNIGVRSQEQPDFNQASFTTLIFNGQVLQGKELPNGDYEYLLSIIEGDNKLNILMGISGEYGGYVNIGSQISEITRDIFVKERPATSMQAILALDTQDKCYAVYNEMVLLNYIPATGAVFLQRYTAPTAGLPQNVAVRFDLLGDGATSPVMAGYTIEFAPGGMI